MRFCFYFGIVATLLLPVFLGTSSALAQTGPDLLIKPWQDGQALDTSTDAVIESSAPTRENPKDDVGLSSYQAFGRWRLFPNQRATPILGYDVSYFNVATSDPALPRHLWDGSVGFAQPITEINKWFVVVTGAAGYAGDTPFSDPHAAYFTGNVIVGKEFNKDRAVVVALNYDGNRSFLPDVPIPAIAYADRYNEVLTYVIGLPINSITYEPLNGLQIDAGLEFFETFSGKIGWEFKKHYSIYGNYVDRLSAFHLSNLPADRRLFLQEHRFEAGFRWNPTQLIKFSLGGGWAFGQEFSTGFDVRGTNTLRHLRDGPFGTATLEIGL
jgi:hypothetical protein